MITLRRISFASTLLCVVVSTAAAQDWPMYKFSPSGTGSNTAEVKLSTANVSGLKLAGSGANAVPFLSGAFGAGPVVANGVVFMGDSNVSGHGGLHAYDAKTFAELWVGQTEMPGQPGFIASAAAVADGVVYVVGASFAGLNRPMLYAFRASGCGSTTCAPLWFRSFTNDAAILTPLTVVDGVIYFGTLTSHTLYAISAATHATLWTAILPTSFHSSAAVSNGAVYVVIPNEGIHAYPVGCRTDGGNCTELWSNHSVLNAVSMPAVDGGFVYVSTDDGYIKAFAADGCGSASCEPVWTVQVTNDVTAHPGPPSAAGGAVYVGYMDSSTVGVSSPTSAGKLVAISATTHNVVWTSTVDTGFSGSIAVANGVVYATSNWEFNGTNYAGAAYAFPATCSSSCAPIWTGPQQELGGGDMAVADAVLYATTPTGFDAYTIAASSLQIEPSPIEFRDQRVEHLTPAEVKAGAVEVTLRNQGPVAVTVTDISTVLGQAGDFYGKGQRACFRSIAPGDSCSFTMFFKPATFGDREDTLQVFDDAPDSPQTARLHGKGAKGRLQIQPDQVVFDDQRVGNLKPAEVLPKGQTVSITNVGTVRVGVVDIATNLGPDSDFYGRGQNACKRELDPAEVCTFTMYFKPRELGDRMDTLEVTDEDNGSPITAVLRGKGVLGTLLIDPAEVAFKDQRVGKQKPAEIIAGARTLTIRNVGRVSVDIGSIGTLQPNSEFYGTGEKACERLLDPDQVCAFTMYFKPTALGLREDTLQILDDQGRLVKTAGLHGVGANPTVSVFPSTLVFSATPLGNTIILPVVVTNTGTVTVEFKNRETRFMGSDFLEVLAPDTCSGTLEPGASCTVNVAFTPHARGSRIGTLIINDDAEPNPQNVQLLGVGVR